MKCMLKHLSIRMLSIKQSTEVISHRATVSAGLRDLGMTVIRLSVVYRRVSRSRVCSSSIPFRRIEFAGRRAQSRDVNMTANCHARRGLCVQGSLEWQSGRRRSSLGKINAKSMYVVRARGNVGRRVLYKSVRHLLLISPVSLQLTATSYRISL